MGAFWAVPWVMFAPALRVIHRLGLPRALTVPVVWTSVEWLRVTIGLGNFDLFLLGYSQARFAPLVQIAEVTGVYGVSFLVAAVNGLLADLYFALRNSGWSPRAALLRRGIVIPAVLTTLAFMLLGGWGAYRISGLRFEDGPRLAIVQPNVRHTTRNLFGVHLNQVIMTEEKIAPGSADLIVWPENAILDDIRREGLYLEDLRWLAERKQAWFLVGALGTKPGRPGRFTNSAFLIDDGGEIVGRYDKNILYPWSEYTPFDRFLARWCTALQRLHRLVNRAGWGYLPTGVAGDEMVLMDLNWQGDSLPFAVLICSENTYPALPADAGRSGARFLLNPTSEGEVGGPLQEQLLRASIFRAIENRIAYVRVGNTGISCFIDPAGRMDAVLYGERGGTVMVPGTLVHQVPLSGGRPTLYARSRDAFAKGCVAISVGLFLWALARRRRVPRQAATAVLLAILLGGCGGPPQPGDDAQGAREALSRGMELFEEGRGREAIGAFAEACATQETCREALDRAAIAFLDTLQPEDGADFFQAVAARYPELEAEARSHRGYLLNKALYVDEAEAEYRASLAVAPSARVCGLLGGLLDRSGRTGEAIEMYRRAVQLDPGDVRLRYLLGRTLRAGGKIDEARSLLESVVVTDTRHAQAWVHLGRIYLDSGETAAAKAAFRSAAAADPGNLEGRLMLARLALREGRREAAMRWLQEIQAIEATLGRGPRAEE
jgi:apolipoprotein N-acyltransferase